MTLSGKRRARSIRGGTEADVVTASLKHPEYCLWRDGKDSQQVQLGTIADVGPRPGSPPLTSAEGGNGECDTKVRQFCEEAVDYIKKGDYPHAIDSYRRALGLDGDNLSALNNLGIVYEKRPEWYPQAVETWKRVLELSERARDEKHAGRARKHLDTLGKLTSAN